ncbi:hypothetical protein DPMN_088460 [Dreissena polymorpha]|uniref:Uncharacterized protein n=1 Tax=Dreissena polymorpha TaxID=45954 RepID=A0A9D4KVW9_DREPO|nr:hypothetical protein DPMN_088460 [Dreissena polymorpha]
MLTQNLTKVCPRLVILNHKIRANRSRMVAHIPLACVTDKVNPTCPTCIETIWSVACV